MPSCLGLAGVAVSPSIIRPGITLRSVGKKLVGSAEKRLAEAAVHKQ